MTEEQKGSRRPGGPVLDPEALEAAARAWWEVSKSDAGVSTWDQLADREDDRLPGWRAALEAGIVAYVGELANRGQLWTLRALADEVAEDPGWAQSAIPAMLDAIGEALGAGPVIRASVVKGYQGPLDPGKLAHRLGEAEVGPVLDPEALEAGADLFESRDIPRFSGSDKGVGHDTDT